MLRDTFAGMLTRYRNHLLLGLLAFACAQGWNRWNINAMLEAQYARYNVRDGRALTATDDASYLGEVDRLMGDRPDLDRIQVQARPDLRPPGYRLWYLLPRLVLPPSPSLSVLITLQCLLYAFAVMLAWEVMLAYAIAAWLRWGLVLLFAVMPTFHGFLFHTITEGVTPALAVIVMSSALLAHRSARWLWVGTIAWSLLTVTRPALGWIGLALIPVLWQWSRSFVPFAATILLAMLPSGLWWLNNMWTTGHYVGLHAVYRVDEPGINRPVHGAFWELAKSWGARGDEFHPVMEDAFRAAMVCDTSHAFADRFVQLAPPGSLTAEQDIRIRDAFHRWQCFNCELLAPALLTEAGTIPITTRPEQGIIFSLEYVTDHWRNDHPFHHHVLVPVQVMKQLVLHSNLNLFLFQSELRGRWWMEALRWASALLHVALMACLLLAALFRTPLPLRSFASGASGYLFYLAYVQRGVEERYTLPVLFVAVLCAAFVVQRFKRPNLATEKTTP